MKTILQAALVAAVVTLAIIFAYQLGAQSQAETAEMQPTPEATVNPAREALERLRESRSLDSNEIETPKEPWLPNGLRDNGRFEAQMEERRQEKIERRLRDLEWAEQERQRQERGW